MENEQNLQKQESESVTLQELSHYQNMQKAEIARLGRSRRSQARKMCVLQELVDEISMHKNDQIPSFRTNLALAHKFGVSKTTIQKYSQDLGKDDQNYRSQKIQSESAKRNIQSHGNPFCSITQEKRSEIMRRVGIERYAKGIGIAKLTTEQRSEICRAIRARQTPEYRRQISRTGGLLGGKKTYVEGKGIYALSPERRKEISRKNGRKNADLGIGLAGLSPQQRSENGKIYGHLGGKAALAAGVGIFGLTQYERSENSKKTGNLHKAKKTLEILRNNRYWYNGNYFDSKSEAACAALMEKFIPEFKVKVGETFQIGDGLPIIIDFFINGVYIEYHPILLFKSNNGLGDLHNIKDFQDFKQQKDGLTVAQKRQLDRELKERVAQAYWEKRMNTINQNPKYSGSELILVQSAEQLYDTIIVRFGLDIPSKSKFIHEFKTLTKQIQRSTKIYSVP